MKANGSFSSDFWTQTLNRAGLESPGYHEAARDAREISRKKKAAKEMKSEKSKQKKK